MDTSLKDVNLERELTITNGRRYVPADENLPIEKQMKVFLTWGVVHRECGERSAADERFRNGLSICDN